MKTARTQITKTMSAPDAYKARMATIKAMQKELNELLEEHAKEGKTTKNWGYTGDLGEVESGLAKILAFLTGDEQ